MTPTLRELAEQLAAKIFENATEIDHDGEDSYCSHDQELATRYILAALVDLQTETAQRMAERVLALQARIAELESSTPDRLLSAHAQLPASSTVTAPIDQSPAPGADTAGLDPTRPR